MSDQVAIGVTGVGGLGRTLGSAIQSADHATVVAVADVEAENKTDAAEEFEVPTENRFSSHEAMLAAADLDGVVIATPHAFHYEQTLAALERDVDTLCEKPLCVDLENAKSLVRASERSSASLMVGYQRHLGAPYRRAREDLSDQVGEPQFITAEITQNWIANQRGSWRANPDLSGGGQLYDTGSHLLDAVLWTTGLTPTSVTAEMQFDDPNRLVDTQASLDVSFDNGAVASIGVSGDTPCVREHVHVWGANGGFYIDGAGWGQRELTYVRPDGPMGEKRQPSLDGYGGPGKVEQFVNVVRNGATPAATARDALKVTAVTEAAYESARTGERVDVELSDLDAKLVEADDIDG